VPKGIKGSAPACKAPTPEPCPEPHEAKGYCAKHYRAWRLYGNPLEARYTKPLCSVDPSHGRATGGLEMCKPCYDRNRWHGDPTMGKPYRSRDEMEPTVRFDALVDRNGPLPLWAPCLGPCWLWTGNLTCKGYAADFSVDGRSTKPHRWSYEHFIGPIPVGLTIDHLCLVKSCVNPFHLEPVTNAENLRRRAERRTQCMQGHPWIEANIYVYKDGRLTCDVCRRATQARADERRRQRIT
jgi:HNH endonuclease